MERKNLQLGKKCLESASQQPGHLNEEGWIHVWICTSLSSSQNHEF